MANKNQPEEVGMQFRNITMQQFNNATMQT
jgi:hypothetical protein